MEERVVKIKIEATVAGKKLDVCGANVVLGINEIPRIELLVPPTQSENSAPLKPNVFKPTLSEFCMLHDELAKAAEDQDKTGDVHISITTYSTASDSNDKPEELDLKNWVLSGVGLSSVGATSAPHLSVILHHPAFWLTKVGSIYDTPKSNSAVKVAEFSAKSDGKFLHIVKAAYDAMKNETQYFPSPSGMSKIYRESLGSGKFDPALYIRDDTKYPFMDVPTLEEMTARLKAAIGKSVCPMGDGSSTWDMIVKSSGTLLLSVVQDEDNNFATEGGMGLVIEPSKPWKTKTVLTLPEDRCFWTEVPGMDMFKLVGVMTRKLRVYATPVAIWANVVGTRPEDEASMCDVLYCPVNPEHADGRIMKTSAPQVLMQAFMENGISGDSISTGFQDGSRLLMSGFDEPLRLYCRAIYENAYCSMKTAKAQMALGFRDPYGKMLLPGNTCRFLSGDKDLYFGYIRSVVHSMSTKGGCSTTIGMSHVRTQLKVEARVPDGDVNAAYDISGSSKKEA